MSKLIVPTMQVTQAPDQRLMSPEFCDIFHPDDRYGQAQHVFVHGNQLLERWRQNAAPFSILECGFGLGHNFVTTVLAWQAASQKPNQLHYAAIDFRWPSLATLIDAHRRDRQASSIINALAEQWPLGWRGLHRLYLPLSGGVVLVTLNFNPLEAALSQLKGRFDAIYLDGFAPKQNPETHSFWSATSLQALKRLSHSKTTLTTWSVARAVQTALTHVGFICQKKPGFAAKRDMLYATMRERKPYTPPQTPNKVAIVGGGLAGAACAWALAMRGVDVVLYDGADRLAQGASNQPAGLLHPQISPVEGLTIRLRRMAFLHAKRLVQWLRVPSLCDGVLLLARDPGQEVWHKQMVDEYGYPQQYAHYLNSVQASAQLNSSCTHGGLFMPDALALAPKALINKQLQDVNVRLKCPVARITPCVDGWLLSAADGQCIDVSGHVVLTTGSAVHSLSQGQTWPVHYMRGQTTLVAANGVALNHALCADGYAIPFKNNTLLLGASHVSTAFGLRVRAEEHRHNLQWFMDFLRQSESPTGPLKAIGGRVGQRVYTADRLPLVGQLPDYKQLDIRRQLSAQQGMAGLYVLNGLGARGLMWASLLAELLADQICGTPLAVEGLAANKLHPARFAWRAAKEGS